MHFSLLCVISLSFSLLFPDYFGALLRTKMQVMNTEKLQIWIDYVQLDTHYFQNDKLYIPCFAKSILNC